MDPLDSDPSPLVQCIALFLFALAFFAVLAGYCH